MNKLTARQLKTIPILISEPSYSAALLKAKISRKTLYQWLKDAEFKAELERQRNELIDAAFKLLIANAVKAAEELTNHLNNINPNVKRLACNDVLTHILHYKESDLSARLEALELQFAQQQTAEAQQ